MPDKPRPPQKRPWDDPSLHSERESDAAHHRRGERDAKRGGARPRERND